MPLTFYNAFIVICVLTCINMFFNIAYTAYCVRKYGTKPNLKITTLYQQAAMATAYSYLFYGPQTILFLIPPYVFVYYRTWKIAQEPSAQ
jgi:hypothetical protein